MRLAQFLAADRISLICAAFNKSTHLGGKSDSLSRVSAVTSTGLGSGAHFQHRIQSPGLTTTQLTLLNSAETKAGVRRLNAKLHKVPTGSERYLKKYLTNWWLFIAPESRVSGNGFNSSRWP